MNATDDVFDALGEPMRRRIVEVLREGPLPVGELADRLPARRPGVSKHLRVLSDAGLVEHRRSGTRNLYALAPPGLATAQQWLVGVWDAALADFAAEAESAGSRGAAGASRERPEAPHGSTGERRA
ncbi:ArsR/SmtB family transcription factor [Microbacterium tumbae]